MYRTVQYIQYILTGQCSNLVPATLFTADRGVEDQHRQGNPTALSMSMVPVDADDTGLHLFCTAQDVVYGRLGGLGGQIRYIALKCRRRVSLLPAAVTIDIRLYDPAQARRTASATLGRGESSAGSCCPSGSEGQCVQTEDIKMDDVLCTHSARKGGGGSWPGHGCGGIWQGGRAIARDHRRALFSSGTC